LDDVGEFICADSEARTEAECGSQTRFLCVSGSSGEPEEYSEARTEAECGSQRRFRCVSGSSGEPEECSDECVDLASCKICVIFTSDTIANILHLQMF